jgi:two-component system CheB/CheR fusion protein
VQQPDKFSGMFLISFEKPEQASPAGGEPAAAAAPAHVAQLRLELRQSKESHQGTVEELETTNEELRSTNEELQSTNEELQSTNEELETSREEMQSLNEELQTVNSELERKVLELSLARDDLKNLLNGTEIATVFLDTELKIKRYTERAKRVIPLIPSDVGRPLGDIVSRLHYDRLLDDAAEVLETLAFKEVEVPGEGDVHYLLRILPYRTADNLIDGLVLTFVDITKLKALQHREQRLTRALDGSPTTVTTQDAGLRYLWASGPVFGLHPDHVVGRTDAELVGDLARELEGVKRLTLQTGKPARTTLLLDRDGRRQVYDLHVKAERAADGPIVRLLSVCTALKERS